jgi:hypothetical protein
MEDAYGDRYGLGGEPRYTLHSPPTIAGYPSKISIENRSNICRLQHLSRKPR